MSYKKAAINKIKKNLRKMPGANRVHKYALLEDDDEDLSNLFYFSRIFSKIKFNFIKGGQKKKKNNLTMGSEDRMGAELKYNDDEDVVYEEDSYRSTPQSKKNSSIVKEYKNIIWTKQKPASHSLFLLFF